MVLRKVLTIAILGLVTSGIFVIFFNYAVSGPDSVQYDRLGYNLASGKGFSLDARAPFAPTMFREPGYPVFLAAIYTVFGHSINVVLFIQMLLHAATAVLAYYIARAIFPEKAAFFSGVAVALFPTLANMAACLLSETFFTFLLCLGLWLFLEALGRKKLAVFSMSGLVLGFLAITKAAALLLPVALAIAAIVICLVKRQDLKSLLIGITAFAIIFCLPVSMWIVRNKTLFNSASMTLRGGEALWSRAQKLDDSPKVIAATVCYSFSESLGNKLFPSVTDRPNRFLFKDFEKAEGLRARYSAEGLTNLQIEEIFKKEASDKISKRPLAYAGYTLIEAIKMTAFTYLPVLNESMVRDRFVTFKGGALMLSGMKGIIRMMAYPILLLFFIAIIKYSKIWDKWILLFTTVAYFNLVYSLLDAIGRYAVPLIPLYCIMAVAALFPALENKSIQKG